MSFFVVRWWTKSISCCLRVTTDWTVDEVQSELHPGHSTHGSIEIFSGLKSPVVVVVGDPVVA